MTWDQLIQYIKQMHGVTQWTSVEVSITASQCTINKSHKDLATTQDYQHCHTIECMNNAQNWLQALAAKEAEKKIPYEQRPHRQGYTHRADWYFVQEYLRHRDVPLMLAQLNSPEGNQFKYAREDSKESTQTDTDTDNSEATSTTTRTKTDHTGPKILTTLTTPTTALWPIETGRGTRPNAVSGVRTRGPMPRRKRNGTIRRSSF